MHCPIGTLQSDKGDIHENAAEKSTLHPVELFRDYPKAPFYLKEGNLPRLEPKREGTVP